MRLRRNKYDFNDTYLIRIFIKPFSDITYVVCTILFSVQACSGRKKLNVNKRVYGDPYLITFFEFFDYI